MVLGAGLVARWAERVGSRRSLLPATMRLQALLLLVVSHIIFPGHAVQPASNETAIIPSTQGGLLKAFQNSSVGTVTVVLERDCSVTKNHSNGVSPEQPSAATPLAALPGQGTSALCVMP